MKTYSLVIIEKNTQIVVKGFTMTKDYFLNEFDKEKAETVFNDFLSVNNFKRENFTWEIR